MRDVMLWRHLGMTSAAGFMLAPAFWPMVIVTVATVSPISSPAGEWPCNKYYTVVVNNTCRSIS